MKLRFGNYFGLFVVLLSGSYISVRWLGAPSQTIPISIACLFLILGLDAIVMQLTRLKKKRDLEKDNE